MSSNVTLSSENKPPWRTRYLDPISVARGNAEKLSENSLNILRKVSVNLETQQYPESKFKSYLSLYLALHSPSKPYTLFMSSVSWFPLFRKKPLGRSHL